MRIFNGFTVLGFYVFAAMLYTGFAHAEEGYGQIVENAERGQGFTVGDMTVRRTGRDANAGNGIDESVSWTFDFSRSDDLNSFLGNGEELRSAELIFLDIEVTNQRVTTDWFGIPGFGGQQFGTRREVTPTNAALINVPSISGLPEVGESGRFGINLLDYGVSSEALMATFWDETDHTHPWYDPGSWIGEASDYTIANAKYAIPFIYMDDAQVRDVQLILSNDSASISARASLVPATNLPPMGVPEPMGLTGMALISGMLLWRKHHCTV